MMTENYFRTMSMNDEECCVVDDSTLELSFSSEALVMRDFGLELLSHDPNDVDLSLLNSGNNPFLLDHIPDDSEKHIGVVSSARIENSRGLATVRLSGDCEKQGIINDIKTGIRPNISVGYLITKRVHSSTTAAGEKIYKCSWRPYEISSVSIGADPTVGVNRNFETEVKPMTPEEIAAQQAAETAKRAAEVEAQQRAATAQNNNLPQPADAADVIELCRKFGLVDHASDLIRAKKTMHDVKEFVFAEVEKRNANAPVFTPSAPAGAPAVHTQEKRSFDLGKAVRAAVTQNWKDAAFEREQCEERALQSGGTVRFDRNIVVIDPNMPVGKRATVTAGTAGSGAELVATDYHPERLIDALWNKTWLDKVGTDNMLGLVGNASFPVISSNATTSWVTETGALPAAQGLTTGLKTISPKEMVAKFEMTRQALIQDVPNVQGKILGQLYNAIAQSLDAAALSGASVALSTTGLLNQVTQEVVNGANGLAPTLAQLRKMRKLLIASKINIDSCSWVMSSSLEETLNVTLKDSANTNSGYILTEGQRTLTGLPFVSSQNVPSGVTKGTSTAGSNGGVSSIILGDFSEFLVAQWGSIAVEFDYVTGADNSKVLIRAFSFWDMLIKRLEAFAISKDFIG